MKDQLKFTAMLLLSGAGLGLLASMFWGPGLISWWWTPPGTGGPLNNLCGDQVQAAASALVKMQLVTGGVLGVLVAAGGHFVRYKRARNAAVGAPPPAPPAA